MSLGSGFSPTSPTGGMSMAGETLEEGFESSETTDDRLAEAVPRAEWPYGAMGYVCEVTNPTPTE